MPRGPSFLLRITPAEHAALVERGFARPCNPSRPAAYLRASGWRYDEGAWWSPCHVDWTLREAVAMQQMRDAVAYLEARGWVVTGGGRGCLCTDRRCTMSCGQYVWVGVEELRDPVVRRYVSSWRAALRTQLRREATSPSAAAPARRAVRTRTGHAWHYRVSAGSTAV